jgi:endonuclease G
MNLSIINRVFIVLLFSWDNLCFPQNLQDFNPAHSSDDQIISHFAYSLKYNEKHEQAEWVIYFLTKNRAEGHFKRTDDFRSDPSVKTGSATLEDYKDSGYDRGHLAPAGDMAWSKEAMSESFFMSNMSLQKPGFNRGIWKNLESQIRSWAIAYEEIYVVTGPVLSNNLSVIGPDKVSVPKYFYKVILDYKEPEIKGIGFILANESSKKPLQDFAVSIDSVEKFTGLDFFPALPDSIENAIESKIAISSWAFFVSQNQSSKPSESKSMQCKGITQKGTRCKRMTTNENGYCEQHQSQAKATVSPAKRR